MKKVKVFVAVMIAVMSMLFGVPQLQTQAASKPLKVKATTKINNVAKIPKVKANKTYQVNFAKADSCLQFKAPSTGTYVFDFSKLKSSQYFVIMGKKYEEPVLMDIYLCYYDNNKKGYYIYRDTKTKNTSDSEYGTNQKGCIQFWNLPAYKEYHAAGMMKTNITKNYGKIDLKKNQTVYIYHVGEDLNYCGPFSYSLKISKKK